MTRIETINYQGKDYATVPARLKEFRQQNPRASISTEPTFLPNGDLIFKATIVKDRADDTSATATGTAMYTAKDLAGKKQFEKLETISIGRALAVLGYLNDGQIASGEEMAEFEEYKSDRITARITEANSVDELMLIFAELSANEKKEFTSALSERKKELTHATAN